MWVGRGEDRGGSGLELSASTFSPDLTFLKRTGERGCTLLPGAAQVCKCLFLQCKGIVRSTELKDILDYNNMGVIEIVLATITDNQASIVLTKLIGLKVSLHRSRDSSAKENFPIINANNWLERTTVHNDSANKKNERIHNLCFSLNSKRKRC